MTIASPSAFIRLPAGITAGVVALNTGPRRLLGLSCFYADDSTVNDASYVQLFDRTTAPSSGVTVPNFSFVVVAYDGAARDGAAGRFSLGMEFFSPQGLIFLNGIAYGLSSTPAVFTAYGAGAQVLELEFTYGPYQN